MTDSNRAPFQVLVVPYRVTSGYVQYCALKRRDLSVWQFVAGGAEHNETARDAATRESFEELGIHGPLLTLQTVCSIPVKYFKARVNWSQDLFVIPEYAFALDCGENELLISSEHLEEKWGSYAEISSMLEWDSNKTALWELNERLLSISKKSNN